MTPCAPSTPNFDLRILDTVAFYVRYIAISNDALAALSLLMTSSAKPSAGQESCSSNSIFTWRLQDVFAGTLICRMASSRPNNGAYTDSKTEYRSLLTPEYNRYFTEDSLNLFPPELIIPLQKQSAALSASNPEISFGPKSPNRERYTSSFDMLE